MHAQNVQENPTYKVDFTIRDTGDAGGKTGRKYSLLVNRNVKSTFKVGNRVPVATGGTSGGTLVNTQFTYIDVGMNIECVVAEAGSRFAIHGDLDISTAVMPDKNVNRSAESHHLANPVEYGYDSAAGKTDHRGVVRRPGDGQEVRYRRGDYEDVGTLPHGRGSDGRRMIRSSIAASTALRVNGIGW